MKNDNAYEFNGRFIDSLRYIDAPIMLQDKFRSFFKIPRELIFKYNAKVLATYLYIRAVSLGEYMLGGTLISVRDVALWLNYSPGKGNDNTINNFLNAFITLRDAGYIDILTDLDSIKGKKNSRILIKVNEDMIEEKCTIKQRNNQLGYTRLYCDEIERISNAIKTIDDDTLKLDTLFKVFSYLRYRIKIKMTLELEQSKTFTETYEGLYCQMIKDIYDDVKSTDTLAKYINVICDLNLIRKKTIKVYNKYNTPENEKPIVTLKTVFCNTYVRYKDNVIRGGEDYCNAEIMIASKKIIKEYLKECKYANKYNSMSDEQKERAIPPLGDDREDSEALKTFEEYISDNDIYDFEIDESGVPIMKKSA